MKKQTKNKFLILLICLLTQACSASNEQKGVVSSEDLTIQTTITTVTTVQDSPEIEDLTEEEAQLILAGCLREIHREDICQNHQTQQPFSQFAIWINS